MAYITLDFGSSNSGALLNTSGQEYNPADLLYVHRQDGDASFTKQPTVFWIKRNILERSSWSENDINIYSCVFHEEDTYALNANFIWCQNQIMKALPRLSNNREWVCIEHPKMELYKKDNSNPANTQIKARDESKYSLKKILNIFFLVIKKECKKAIKDASMTLRDDDINWGITVPGMAIWNQDAVDVIKDVAHSVFGNNLTLWSEPECALIGINIAGRAEVDFVKDRYSLIADLGGGTTDICVMKETLNPDGVTSFDEVKSTLEGKDSTTSKRAGGNDIDRYFKSFFCDYLTEGAGINDASILLFSNFLRDNPAGAMEFDKKWHELQFKGDIDGDKVSFNPGRPFVDWLRTHYPVAAKKRDEYGEFVFDGEKFRNYVFSPVYNIIIKSIEENLSVLKQKNRQIDAIYFAGGLSLDKRLKKMIKVLTNKYFPYARFKEAAEGSVVGAVQRGGNHIAVNKETLIHRLSRKTFYTEFVMDYKGNKEDLRDSLGGRLRYDYHDRFGIWLSNEDIKKKIDEQWPNMIIDYSDGSVAYFTPLCLRFAPATQIQSFDICPFHKGNQTSVKIKVFSSDKNFILFKNQDVKDEGEFEHEFGYNWEKAKLVFDPTSNAVEGIALFYIADNDGNKLSKGFEIKNVSKRGI